MIHHLEKFLASAETAHSIKELEKRPDTLIAVNPMTRPPPMCPGKKKPWPPEPKKDASTSTSWEEGHCRIAHMRSQCLVEKITCKKRRLFVNEHHIISAEPNRPIQGCRAHKYKWFEVFMYSI